MAAVAGVVLAAGLPSVVAVVAAARPAVVELLVAAAAPGERVAARELEAAQDPAGLEGPAVAAVDLRWVVA